MTPAWSRTSGEVPPQVRSQVLRLPACFRSFDQHPEDIRSLARRFSERWPDRTRRLAVVGVRTSGSYLAPLCVAALQELGYANLAQLTVRPNQPLMAGESRLLREVAVAGGMALLVDDPPVTGRSVSAVARQVRQSGLPPHAIVALLARPEAQPEALPALSPYLHVTLSGPDWRIVRALRAEAVARALRDFLPPTTELLRLDVHTELPGAAGTLRAHLSASYTAELHDRATQEFLSRDLVAEGVGLGYFGRHAVAVGRALHGWVPAVHGFTEGVLVRDATAAPSLTNRSRLWADAGTAEHVAEYVLARRRALPSTVDRSMHMAGQCPVWEVAAGHLCPALGRLGMPLRIPLLDPILRFLLSVTNPGIIDGRMFPDHWRHKMSGRSGLLKENFAEGAFSNRELFCYDPVFDLAGAAVHTGCEPFAARLREYNEVRTGERVPEERWLVYQLVHHRAGLQAGRVSSEAARRGCAKAVQRYFAAAYLDDVTPAPTGPCCALDVDGVLEISPLGFSMTTVAGATALRSLLVHGYQPLLATGRNLEDLRDRCESYGLAGGVAEYGALVYQSRTGTVTELVSARARADLARLRAELARIPGVHIDPGHRLTLRAYREVSGERRGVEQPAAEAAVRSVGLAGRVRVVPGDTQTDFVPVEVDKSVGLRHLLAGLAHSAERRPLALAVGDGPADGRMLAMATLGLAPRNGHPALRRYGAGRTSASYQAGLGQAVSALLGHPAGSCATCRVPALPAGTRALVALMSVMEAGRVGMPARLAGLVPHAVRARWHQ